jgi:tetratricopeptide (TPR) repeat protein
VKGSGGLGLRSREASGAMAAAWLARILLRDTDPHRETERDRQREAERGGTRPSCAEGLDEGAWERARDKEAEGERWGAREEEGVVLLAQVLSVSPSNWVALCTQGRRRLSQGRRAEGKRLLAAARSAAPWHAEATMLLVSEMEEEAGEREAAQGMLEAVLDVDPSNVACLARYAKALAAQGDREGAEAVLEAALEAEDSQSPPLDSSSLLLLAALRKHRVPAEYSAHDVEKLLIQAVIASDFADARALYALATWVCCYRDGLDQEEHLADAQDLLALALQADPAHAPVLVASLVLRNMQHALALRHPGPPDADEEGEEQAPAGSQGESDAGTHGAHAQGACAASQQLPHAQAGRQAETEGVHLRAQQTASLHADRHPAKPSIPQPPLVAQGQRLRKRERERERERKMVMMWRRALSMAPGEARVVLGLAGALGEGGGWLVGCGAFSFVLAPLL